MKYLLDTDTVTRIGRADAASVTQRVAALPTQDMAVSVITRGEIEYGLIAATVGRATLERMRGLLAGLRTLPLTERAAAHYADIRNSLRAAGTPIGHNDLWIAAHALSEGLIVVTNNEREFRRVPGLRIENWLR